MRRYFTCLVTFSMIACTSDEPEPSNMGAGGATSSAATTGSGAQGTGGSGASMPTCANPEAPGRVPAGSGWHEIPASTLESVCSDDPNVQGVEGCAGIINDWSGGMADTCRNRLLIWGGGHNGYYGNELYAFSLADMSMHRLNEPSAPHPDPSECVEELADGTPASRHTYDALTYITHADRMFAFGGSLACYAGNFGADTWMLDLESLTWERRDPHRGGTPYAAPGVVADYDPESRLVYLHDTYDFWSYDYDSNTYTLLAPAQGIDYHLTGRVDVQRRKFFIFGNGALHVADIGPGSSYELSDLAPMLTGCDALIAAIYPGIAYDEARGMFVGWGGGDTVYEFDPDSLACTPVEHPSGPGPQNNNGTMGRFRFFPQAGAYVVVNDWQQNAHMFIP